MLKQSDIICDYPSLVDALRKRRNDLSLSCMELEAISGLQEGYVTKLENHGQPYGRSFGAVSLPLWLGGLNVGLCLIELPPRRL
ncbi:hypothetical protein D7I41_04330 [Ochrobactrum sp. MH181795]|uniref:helix-turn-helix domain-containing protein n=1 Tax=Brucella TaxID=234 RepID=UPI000DECB4A2|nr:MULTISPECIES: hypothetical protein [Brucella]MCB4920030.1 hypothetical protein [Brucella intermedia]RCI79531.1 hypothetical protein DNK03_08160 [Brucella anthropi]RNL46361.1 hypothetical protein D7I41_04330 [Ochrobactrum sp. MH181795]